MQRDLLGTAYDLDGAGPTLVLIHGMGLNRNMWDGFLDDLTANFQIVRYDLLGHGESPSPSELCDLNHLLDQLRHLLNEIGVERAAVAGFSLGGTLALAMAAKYPELTAAIAVMNSANRRDSKQRASMEERLRLTHEQGPAGTVNAAIERWFTDDFRASRPDVTRIVRDWILANDPDDYAAIYRVLVEGDDFVLPDGRILADALPDIDCPALILTGEHDANSTPAMTNAMAKVIPNGQATIIPRLRHMGLAEDPKLFLNELLPFFNSVFGTSRA